MRNNTSFVQEKSICFFFDYFRKMISASENIDLDKIDGHDEDSDVPVEITTKTSKIETRKKKKKKSGNKRRIKYNLATEEGHDLEKKRLDEESALTHLVFGDDDDYLEEITSAAKSKTTVSIRDEQGFISIEWILIVRMNFLMNKRFILGYPFIECD